MDFRSLNRTLLLRSEGTHARECKKSAFFFAFRSLNRTFDLWSKVLPLGKFQIKFGFPLA